MDYLHPAYILAHKFHKLRRKHELLRHLSRHQPPSPSSSPPSISGPTRWLPRTNNLISGTIPSVNLPPKYSHFQSSEESLPVIDGSTSNNNNINEKLLQAFIGRNSTMWPYQSYKPISWDKYYAHDMQDKHVSITSGLAAGITIGVFFAVFLLTFGCRLYSQRADNRNRSQASSPRRRLSVSDLLGWPSTPCQPPPPYEIAIQMPAPCSTTTLNTLVTTPCDPPAPTYEDSCRTCATPDLSYLPTYSPTDPRHSRVGNASPV